MRYWPTVSLVLVLLVVHTSGAEEVDYLRAVFCLSRSVEAGGRLAARYRFTDSTGW